MQNPINDFVVEHGENPVEVRQIAPGARKFVPPTCPTDPAELEQCDSCQ